MKILILGAAGQISKMLINRLLQETDAELVLYARNANRRIANSDPSRITIVDGDFNDSAKLLEAMEGVAIVYLNDMNSPEATQTIVDAAKKSGVAKIIAATILGIYDEVIGEFGKWNARMVGCSGTNRHKESAKIIEDSGIDFTLLRLTWLYNQEDNERYMVSQKGEPFIGAQVARQAVARLIMDIIENPAIYSNKSLGVSEPNTDFPKPSFY
ncbi:MAG: NAD(P)H-binding protein [Trichococcus flocculiformis]